MPDAWYSSGAVEKAWTIEALGSAIGVPSQALRATVNHLVEPAEVELIRAAAEVVYRYFDEVRKRAKASRYGGFGEARPVPRATAVP